MTCTPERHDEIRQSPALWSACALVGWQGESLDPVVLELRNCRDCGSTLALERRGFVWCPGYGSGRRGHPEKRGTAGVETDALGRVWCAPCRRTAEADALYDARNNDGLTATETRDR